MNRSTYGEGIGCGGIADAADYFLASVDPRQSAQSALICVLFLQLLLDISHPRFAAAGDSFGNHKV